VRVGERVPEWLIHAQPTMTLALPKLGLEAGLAAGLVGELYLADIGVPPQLYAEPRLQLAVPDMFARSDPARLQ
jgi:NAD(P)H-hydrate epimerase